MTSWQSGGMDVVYKQYWVSSVMAIRYRMLMYQEVAVS